MQTRTEKVRLFVAVYPPRDVVVSLARFLRAVDLPEHRVSGDVHLTVHFIGPVERRELPRIRETLERSASGIEPFVVKPVRLVGLPERNPRLVAVELDCPPELAELHRRLAHRLRGKPSGRAYLPHMTLARWHAGGRVHVDPVTIEMEAFEVRDVQLMSSVLKPSGAEHHLLGLARLGEV